jgi:hypothetical protein
MTGYGGQSRANSSNVMSFMGSNYDGYVEDPPAPPPELPTSLDVPPAISVIQVNIRTFPIDQRPVD